MMKHSSVLSKIILILCAFILLADPMLVLAMPQQGLTTVTTPEMPALLSLNPNQMNEIDVASPDAMINLIEPPLASATGDARLSYPIEIPPGRLGIQPTLSIEYNSSNANGWLGMGWDIPLPAIAVDTRWGVPRYLADQESETYLLNGEQLTPVAHRSPFEVRDPSVTEKQFHLRVEGEFQRIIRYGNAPNNFSWEVTDKDGTISYYGGEPNSICEELGDTYSILTDNPITNDGNIFVWPIRMIRDTHGNNVQLCYTRIQSTGLPNGTVPGHQLYLHAIYYTGHNEQPGPFRVEFLREGGRPDVILDARGGFKQVTDELLTEIVITYGNTPVRTYTLEYKEGAFQKSLLTSIEQYGEDGELFNTHEFDYYDEIRDPSDGNYLGFMSPAEWDTHEDNVDIGEIPVAFDFELYGQASAISGATSDAYGGSLYGGFNPESPTKDGSVGVSFGYTHSDTTEDLVLIDINGDNLPDKVFNDGSGYVYRQNQHGPQGPGDFSSIPYDITNLHALGEESSDTISFGPEVYMVVNAMFNTAFSFTNGPVYLTDVNSDGLVDLVENGYVWFNSPDGNGNLIFYPHSSNSPVPITQTGTSGEGLFDAFNDLIEEAASANPLHDTFRAWVAPFNGIVQVSGDIQLVEGEGEATDDGVKVSIEFRGQSLWSEVIDANDHSPKTPTGVDNIEVYAGEKIFFRVHSIYDGANDRVRWDPEIDYISSNASYEGISAVDSQVPDWLLETYPEEENKNYRKLIEVPGAGESALIFIPPYEFQEQDADLTSILEAIDQAWYAGSICRPRVYHSMRNKVENAQAALDQGHVNTAVNKLEALTHELEAYAGNCVDAGNAQTIIKIIEDTIAVITKEQPPTSEPSTTPEPSATPSPEPSATASPEPSATASPEPSATPSPEPSATASPEPSATPSPEPSATPSPEPSATASPEPSATPSPEPSATPSPEPSATPSPKLIAASAPTDPNLLDVYHYQASQDFVMAGRRGILVAMPFNGTVRLEGNLQKLGVTTDDITLLVQKNGVVIFSETLNWDVVGNIPLFEEFSVNENDTIQLRIKVDSPVDLTQIAWVPKLYYIDSPDVDTITDLNGEYIIQLHPPYDIDIYPVSYPAAPPTSWVSPSTGTIQVVTNISTNFMVIPPDLESYEVIFTVKRPGELVLKRTITISPGMLGIPAWVDNISAELDVFAGEELYFEYSVYDPVLATYINTPTSTWLRFVPDPQQFVLQLAAATGLSVTDVITALENGDTPAQILSSAGITEDEFLESILADLHNDVDEAVANKQIDQVRADEIMARARESLPGILHKSSDFVGWESIASSLHTAYNWDDPFLGNGLFAQPYRGWLYAGYNGNDERGTQPIDESKLFIEWDNDITVQPSPEIGGREDPINAKGFDAATSYAYPFYPSPEEIRWVSIDQEIWIDAAEMVSSRLGVRSIPRIGSDTLIYAVPRVSYDSQIAVELGIVGVSGAVSTGTSQGKIDYLDLNGDLFPDIISNNQVVYSTVLGGLEPDSTTIGSDSPVRESSTWGYNFGFGANPPIWKSDSQGRTDANTSGRPTENEAANLKASLGIGWGQGESEVDWDLIDLNGDGLPDRVWRDGSQLWIAFNLGYGFAAPEFWSGSQINDGASESYELQGGLGFNKGIYDFAGGMTFDRTESISEETIVDINGDGLPDRVRSVPDSSPALCPGDDCLIVNFNTGSGFSDMVVYWPGAMQSTFGALNLSEDPRISMSSNASLGFGTYFTIGIGPLCLAGCYIIINPGFDYTDSRARQEIQLIDMNGDGFADHVQSSDDSSINVALNPIGRTNLLKTVRRPLGASIELEYKRDGNTTDMPDSRWILSKVLLDDGYSGDGADVQVTQFQYNNGYYDLLEREFYGYAQVIEEHVDPGSGTVYRTITSQYDNSSYYTRGLLTLEIVKDGNGNKYVATEHTYFLRDVNTGIALQEANAITASVFPELQRMDKRFYEGQENPGIETYQTYEYDEHGNLIHFVDTANVGPEDDLEVLLEYFEDSDNYIVGKPQLEIMLGNGVEMRRRESILESGTGDITQVREYLADGNAAVNDIEFDEYGNIIRVIAPENYVGQRYTLAFVYDDQVFTYITDVQDESFGYYSTSTYNVKYGFVETSTDINGNSTEFTYDQFGRLAEIVGPHQIESNPYTLHFEYHPDADVPWALTQQIDEYRDRDDPIETALFMDGLTRVIQIKKDGTIHTGAVGSSRDVMIVSGATVFDFMGRPIEQYYPITESLGNKAIYNTDVDTVPPTVLTYDVLDRVTSITMPDKTTTQHEYGFGPDRQGQMRFSERVTNANGIPKNVYRDVRGLIAAIEEFNDGGNQVIWTSYAYDALGQLVQVVDDQHNVTEVTYDNLGRRTHINSPDGGLVENVYDLASNPIQRIPASLQTEDKAIVYDYDYNRLTNISYPNFPENNVSITYGKPGGERNRIGRVVTIRDESGIEEYYYGVLGEVVRTDKTVASDTQGNSVKSPEIYTTEYVYDTWNRLQSLIYPDGEILTYEYDSGGLVNAVSGIKEGNDYEYINRFEYDKFGDPVFVEGGNGVRTFYDYNPLNRFLEVIQSGKSVGHGNLFQNIQLTCDNVGNITSQVNLAEDPSPSRMGGATQYTYIYDDLNRLVHAEGNFDYRPNKQHIYQLDLVYDTIHNIISKTQIHEIRQPSGQSVPQHETTYDWQYEYGSSRPHAPTAIGELAFSYDADGNMAGWDHTQNGTSRTITWDEESRIQAIADNGHTITYKYNAAGERVIRQGPQGETVYVNTFFTIRNREVGIKHIYANGLRIASKLMQQDKPGANPRGRVPVEKDIYFYHPDHLGTSIYVTDDTGAIYEHLEYFPFGETFVEESSNTQRTPYLFTAKELDEETQLYYYGARYYDPQQSTWLSPDPMLSIYLVASGSDSGIYHSQNLNLYSYAYQNPVTYHDPDGNEPRRGLYRRRRDARQKFVTGIAREAQEWQGHGQYPGIDVWENIIIPKGTRLIAGIEPLKPNQARGAFYIDYASAIRQEYYPEQGNPNAERYYRGAQVTKGNYPKHRKFIGVFTLQHDVQAAKSVVRANPAYGEGGLIQYYIPNWQHVVSGPVEMRLAYHR